MGFGVGNPVRVKATIDINGLYLAAKEFVEACDEEDAKGGEDATNAPRASPDMHKAMARLVREAEVVGTAFLVPH